MKITTKDGQEFEVRWLEVKDGKAFSIKNTIRIFIKKSNRERFVVDTPEPVMVSLDYALKHKGNVHVYKLVQNGRSGMDYKGSFINIEDQGEFIRGVKKIKKDTATLMIPVDQIEEINLLNRDISVAMPLVLIPFFAISIPITYLLLTMHIRE